SSVDPSAWKVALVSSTGRTRRVLPSRASRTALGGLAAKFPAPCPPLCTNCAVSSVPLARAGLSVNQMVAGTPTRCRAKEPSLDGVRVPESAVCTKRRPDPAAVAAVGWAWAGFDADEALPEPVAATATTPPAPTRIPRTTPTSTGDRRTSYDRLFEPDALVVAALGVEEQGDQGDLEQQVQQAAAEGAAPREDHQGEREKGHGDAQDVAPLPLVGDAVPGGDAADRDEGKERYEEPAEEQGDGAVDVQQEDGDLKRLRLRLVDPPALFHGL